MPCDVPDEQMGTIISAIALPDPWQDRLLAKLHLEDEVKRVEKERKEMEQRLRRLGQVYLDNLIAHEEYKRQKRQLEEKLQLLVVPGIDAATEAGKLLVYLSYGRKRTWGRDTKFSRPCWMPCTWTRLRRRPS
jgi:hypothetical protein